MIKLSILIGSILFFIILSSCGQAQKPKDKESYVVDNSIKSQIDKKTKIENDVALSSLDVKMYRDDILVLDTYAKGQSIDECITYSSLQRDTITIIGFVGMFAGFGYQIDLFRDTCIVRHFAKSDVEMYKLHKSDSLTFGVSVPCRTYKLTLSKKPAYEAGEVIEGIIELVSEDYYEVANGKEGKYKMQLTGYFRTEPLGKGQKINE